MDNFGQLYRMVQTHYAERPPDAFYAILGRLSPWETFFETFFGASVPTYYLPSVSMDNDWSLRLSPWNDCSAEGVCPQPIPVIIFSPILIYEFITILNFRDLCLSN